MGDSAFMFKFFCFAQMRARALFQKAGSYVI